VITCSFRESVSQIDAGPSVGSDDVDINDGVELKPKTEPDSPSNHQHHQPQQCGGGANSTASSQSSSCGSSAPDESHHVTSSHLLALPHRYHHQQMSATHQSHQLNHHQQQHGYGMSASCAMGLEGIDAAVGFAAAAAAHRSFAPTSFCFAPAHRIGATYYDAVRQAGFDSM